MSDDSIDFKAGRRTALKGMAAILATGIAPVVLAQEKLTLRYLGTAVNQDKLIAEKFEADTGIRVQYVAVTTGLGSGAFRLVTSMLNRDIYQPTGGNALYASNPLQEIFRDATAGAAHVSINWHRSAPYYGQIRLGQTVDIDAM